MNTEIERILDEVERRRAEGKANTPKIKAQEVIEVCGKFLLGELDQAYLDEWCQKIYIQTYLPMADKIRILLQLETQSVRALQGSFLFWNGLISYTNIEFDENLCNIDTYDICYPILGKWLLSYCGEDYALLEKMVMESYDIQRLQEIQKLNELLEGGADIKEAIEQLQENEELIKDISSIAAFNNPTMKSMVEEMQKSALQSRS